MLIEKGDSNEPPFFRPEPSAIGLGKKKMFIFVGLKTRGMKKLFPALLLLLAVQLAWAGPATPSPVRMRQPDGSYITLRIHGDEFYNWYSSEDGKTLYTRDADLWWRPAGAVKHSPARLRSARTEREKRETGLTSSDIAKGNHPFLVLLVQWSDKSFTSGAADYFNRALNGQGFKDYNAVGSVREYYEDASAGQFSPEFHVVGPITIPRGSTEFPEEDDSGHHYMGMHTLMDALPIIDSQVDFSQYDVDKDGYVDNVYLIYPGQGQSDGGGPDTIWPHQFNISKPKTYDGVLVRRYACSPEFDGGEGNRYDGIGTFCHEFGHVLGLPDLYDTDYEENGKADHPYYWNLMASGGNHEGGYVPPRLSTFERYLLGYISETVDLGPGAQTIPSLDEHKMYRIPAATPGEFFLPEVRNGKDWDRGLPAGLLLYHIDASQNVVSGVTAAERIRSGSKINGFADHPCDYLLIPYPDLVIYNRYSILDPDYKTSLYEYLVFPKPDVSHNPYKGYYEVRSYELEEWSGVKPYRLDNISYSAGTASASFTLSVAERKIVGSVTDAQGNPIPGATILVNRAPSASHVPALSLASLRPSSLIQETADENGNYCITLSAGQPEQLTVSCFADNYLPAEETYSGNASARIDFLLSPVLAGGTEQFYTKASFPISSGGRWGYDEAGQHYTVAQHYTAAELASHVGGEITSISYSSYATGEEVWVFVDYGATRRVLAQQVSTPVSKLYADYPANEVVLTQPVSIPAGTDLYIGYAVKNANAPYVMFTDRGQAVAGGFCMYYDFSSTEPGGKQWTEPAFKWGWKSGNALIGFTMKDQPYVDRDATLTDLGYPYIQVPEGKLRAGDTLDLKVVGSLARPYAGISWKMDGDFLEGDSITLTSGEHEIEAVMHYDDKSTETLQITITVL